ncbi:prolyl aminopeptidase [Jannaschia rubra]|uniref:Proline iminopeptidase n=1 Tax=Jannaschia rubra TaxID=282197 RepID=A0A0M6XNT9_9RHOB|nr:prolyl aminopeptidase [Jannaschia rubra]CTQ32588.1 Proline iminopeptidase [Jannaschia rubra]SFF85543.1 proline iminopeptidase [Jannaschia rubra]
MDRHPHQTPARALYPPLDPFDQRTVDVGQGHHLYVEQCGNPDGLPVVVLHGGPGGGCSPMMRRFFDPAIWRVVLFDQRGCGRSRPHASVADNTTWHLVDDIERIRTLLGIDRWAVFGGSWGATLALVYAITHPDRAAHLFLRGVFLMERRELDWFYGGGAGVFWPEQWERFLDLLPAEERGDPIAAYHRRLFDSPPHQQIRFARAWAAWENALASVGSQGRSGEPAAEYARAFARLENHYFVNSGFLEHDGWIRDNLQRIADVPGHVVQGRYDMICPPRSAHLLVEGWPTATLDVAPFAGHALSEAGIAERLIAATDAVGATHADRLRF